LFTDPPRFLAATAASVASVAVAAILTAGCTTSQTVDLRRDSAVTSTGEAGADGIAGGAGVVGTSGAAGSGGGTTTGAAGASSTGRAGSTGSGSSGGAGAIGSGTAGTGATGTGTGTAGTGGGKVDAGAAGGSGVIDAGAPEVKIYTYTTGIENLLIQNCGGCHFAAPGVNVQGGFSFSYANVTGVVTTQHAGCPSLDASKRRVVPGKPDNSLLYIKASIPSPPSACGGHMPFQGSMLSQNVLDTIKNWILAGAPM
jgi:hypothetical protein